MTVCAAALAAGKTAIVCVADKAVSYGGLIQWDASDSGKIIKLNPSGSVVMISDEGDGPRVLDALFEKAPDIGAKKRATIRGTCEEQYRVAVDNLVEAKYLRPRLLDRSKYVAAITAPEVNHLLRSLADEIKAFDMQCDLLVCGFDIDRVPFIFDIGSPGIARDMTMTGFQAIGAGWEKAVSRLLFAEHKSQHSIERVLYDCFDAKANAEMTPTVGYEWDAVVIRAGDMTEVPKDIKELIEDVWGKFNRSPFDKFDPKEHKRVPKDWPDRLREWSRSLIVPSEFQTLEDQQ
jgi:hypothetical protein